LKSYSSGSAESKSERNLLFGVGSTIKYAKIRFITECAFKIAEYIILKRKPSRFFVFSIR